MFKVLVAITTIANLATVVTSFNVQRPKDEMAELEEIRNNIDWYIFLRDSTENPAFSPSNRNIITTAEPDETVTDPDPLSVVWYLGAFGGLIAFFLVVSFSEWCCASKPLYRRQSLAAPYLTGTYSTESHTPDTPPPPYHLFAPPPYSEAAITIYEKSEQTAAAATATTNVNNTTAATLQPEQQQAPPPIYFIPIHNNPHHHHQQRGINNNCTAATITANNSSLTAAQLALLPPPPPYPAILAPPTVIVSTMDTQMAAVPT